MHDFYEVMTGHQELEMPNLSFIDGFKQCYESNHGLVMTEEGFSQLPDLVLPNIIVILAKELNGKFEVIIFRRINILEISEKVTPVFDGKCFISNQNLVFLGVKAFKDVFHI